MAGIIHGTGRGAGNAAKVSVEFLQETSWVPVLPTDGRRDGNRHPRRIQRAPGTATNRDAPHPLHQLPCRLAEAFCLSRDKVWDGGLPLAVDGGADGEGDVDVVCGGGVFHRDGTAASCILSHCLMVTVEMVADIGVADVQFGVAARERHEPWWGTQAVGRKEEERKRE